MSGHKQIQPNNTNDLSFAHWAGCAEKSPAQRLMNGWWTLLWLSRTREFGPHAGIKNRHINKWINNNLFPLSFSITILKRSTSLPLSCTHVHIYVVCFVWMDPNCAQTPISNWLRRRHLPEERKCQFHGLLALPVNGEVHQLFPLRKANICTEDTDGQRLHPPLLPATEQQIGWDGLKRWKERGER